MSCLSQGEEIANVWVWKWASNWSLLSHFSRVRLCATPETAAHQAPPSLGFSRQEHWSGLPFPSPMHESEKWKWSCSVMSDLATPWTAAYQAPPSMGFSRQEYWSRVPLPSPNWSLVPCNWNKSSGCTLGGRGHHGSWGTDTVFAVDIFTLLHVRESRGPSERK